MAVTVSGALLASLCFEHSNSDADQEGFLLGNVVSHVTDHISDSQLNNVKEETVTYICNYIPTGSSFTWYTKSGSIVHERLKYLLKGRHKEVVGWYRFRRNSTLRMSLRERAIHISAQEAFPGVPAHNFLYALFTSSSTSKLATHSYDHIFSSFDGRAFHNLSLNVVNLKDTSQTDYKLHSNSVSSTSGFYNSTLTASLPEFRDDAGKMHQVVSIHTLNSLLHQQLSDLCDNVADSEKEILGLSAELDDLRLKCKDKVPIIKKMPQRRVQEHLMDKPIPGSTMEKSGSLSGTQKTKTSDLDIHEDLRMLVDPPADILMEPKQMPNPMYNNPFASVSDNSGRKRTQSETLVSEKSTSPVPTSLDLNNKRTGEESKRPGKSRSKEELEKSECKENTKKDAFSFVEDIITSAKATSPTIANMFKSSTLPRTSAKPTQDASTEQDKNKHCTTGSSKSNSLPKDNLLKSRNTRSNSKTTTKSDSTGFTSKAGAEIISSDSSEEEMETKEIELSSSPVY